jgi:hypothetical protein
MDRTFPYGVQSGRKERGNIGEADVGKERAHERVAAE